MTAKIVALCALLAAGPAAAQERPDAAPARRLVPAGILGGAAGWVAGAFLVGGPLGRTNPFDSELVDDGFWTPGLVVGFELGQAVGIPLTMHLVNGRRSNLAASMAASLAIGAIGTALLWTEDFDAVFESPPRQAVLIAVPVAQILSSLYFENRLGQRN